MSAKTELAINFRGVDKTAGTLNKINSSITGFATKAAASLAGIFAFRAVMGGASNLIKGLHGIGDASRKVGMDTESFQRFGAALGQVGLQAEDAGTYLMFMKKNIGIKSDMANNIFERMGMDIAALKAQNPTEQFASITKSIASMGNETDRVQALTEIFGRKGGDLAPLLRAGPEAFAQSLQAVMGMVPVASQQAVDMASNMDDALGSVAVAMKSDFAAAFLGIANSGQESFGRVDVAIFAMYQKAKLFIQNTVSLFGFLKDHVDAVFTDKTFADITPLADRMVDNIEGVNKAIADYKHGVLAKDILAQQLKDQTSAGEGLRNKLNQVKQAVSQLGKMGLSGTYEMIKTQFGGRLPQVGGIQQPQGVVGKDGANKQLISVLTKIEKNTSMTADSLDDLEEF